MSVVRGQTYLELRARTIDRAVAAVGLVVFAPLLAVVAAAVLVLDGGPVTVRLARVGRDGAIFQQIKFRTMRSGGGGPSITSGSDSRVTGIGALLRRYRLDELTQMINVVHGDMSLIGPRPETPDMVDGSGDWPVVLSVRPGIAGVTQSVFAPIEPVVLDVPDHQAVYRNEVLPAKLAVDRWYVENAGPIVDLQIVAATLGAIIERPIPRRLKRRIPDTADRFSHPKPAR